MVWLSHLFPKRLGLRHWCQDKSSPGVEPIRTIMTKSSCKTFYFISRILRKQSCLRRNCRAIEFRCLHLASKIRVKQAQPAKYDTKPSQLYNMQMKRSISLSYKHVSLACLRWSDKIKLKAKQWTETSVLSSWCFWVWRVTAQVHPGRGRCSL